jgi:hypothetical protein
VRRLAGDHGSVCLYVGSECLDGENLICQPDLQGFFGMDIAPGKHQFHCPAQSNQTRE